MIMRLARRGAFGGICRVFACALRHYLAVLLRPTGITADSGQLQGGGGRFDTVAVISASLSSSQSSATQHTAHEWLAAPGQVVRQLVNVRALTFNGRRCVGPGY